jgi:diguanylate cyclase (GGDEF)-like protein/PAS domain S-box-containing protein
MSNSTEPASSHAQYEDLFQRMLDAVFLLDYETFSVVDVNPAGEELLKVPYRELQGKELLPWIEEEDQADFKKALRISKRRYFPRGGNVSKWKTQDGNKVLVELVICTLMLRNKREVIQMIVKDITKQHEAETKAQRYLEELKTLNQKLEALSITDELTRLANFRSFKTKLAEEHMRARRYGGKYSLVFCDLDHFKHYNDTNGHPAGDALLRTLGEIISKSTRAGIDFAARYGGEEFVIICPETSTKDASNLANRLRKNIEEFPFPNREKQPLGKVSISVGIATFPENGASEQEITQKADEAVYYSKHHGRNRITTVNEMVDPPPNKVKS